MFTYLGYLGFEIFKKLTNVAKYSGIIYYNDFHIFPITDNLSVSSLPRKDYSSIVNNFNVIIGFLGENEYGNKEVEWIGETPIKYYNISVPDYTSPQINDYLRLFRILDSHPHAKILIHCYAGKGRSNCGIAATLMHQHHLSAQKAIELTERKNPRSSMNRWQKDSLYKLECYLKEKKSNHSSHKNY